MTSHSPGTKVVGSTLMLSAGKHCSGLFPPWNEEAASSVPSIMIFGKPELSFEKGITSALLLGRHEERWRLPVLACRLNINFPVSIFVAIDFGRVMMIALSLFFFWDHPYYFWLPGSYCKNFVKNFASKPNYPSKQVRLCTMSGLEWTSRQGNGRCLVFS